MMVDYDTNQQASPPPDSVEYPGVALDATIADLRVDPGQCRRLAGSLWCEPDRHHEQYRERGMKRFLLAVVAGALGLPTLQAWAQQAPAGGATTSAPAPAYDYGHHMWGWGDGWGWHPGMFLAPFVMLLALIGIVALIVWLVRVISHGTHHHGPIYGHGQGRSALDILEERFARGEIGKEEFEEKRKLIGR
jgi:putative membrane protein